MRAIIIDAKKREVYEAEIDGDLKSMQGIVDGYIERATSPDDNTDLWVNEEGLMNGLPDFFTFEGAHQPFAGNGLLLGNAEHGEGVESAGLAPAWTVDRVKAMVAFKTRAELQEEFARLGM